MCLLDAGMFWDNMKVAGSNTAMCSQKHFHHLWTEAFGAGAGVGKVSSNASDANILFEATSRTSGFQTGNPSKEGTTTWGWSVGLVKPNKEAS